jgi:hypothetical protein
MTEKLKLDWSSANVSDGTLVVSLSGRPQKKWRDAFARAAALLSHGTWDAALNSRGAAVKVDPVRPGEEERVHQFLEGALLEANRTILTEGELFTAPDGEPDDDDEPENSPDEEMTERFRAFAAR